VAEEDLRDFIREVTRRNEVVWQGVVGELREGRTELINLQGVTAALQLEIAGQRDQIRAQTEALWRLLDERFGRPSDED
jgi:hypothetical protein